MGKFGTKPPLDIDFIAAELEKAKRVSVDGNVGFVAPAYSELISIIDTAYEFRDPTLCQEDRLSIVRLALTVSGAAGVITRQSLAAALNAEERKYLAQPLRRFYVYTSVVLGWPYVAQTAIIGAVTVSLQQRVPRTVREAWLQWPESLPHVDHVLERLQKVRIAVNARTFAGAVDTATYHWDLLRGLWNYIRNFTRLGGMFENRLPVNRIRPGPFMTLHYPSGQPATTSTYWTERTFELNTQLTSFNVGDWARMRSDERTVRKAVAKTPYRETLEAGFTHYCRALDQIDGEIALIKLWGLLETLTGASLKGGRGRMVRRCAYVMDEPKYPKIILSHIRKQRNGHVHGVGSPNQCDEYVWQLKRYVEALMSIHCGMGRRFKNMAEACQFFDLPHTKPALQRRIRTLRLAIHFRRDPPTPAT